ncbi:Uncharacterized protein NEOC65_001880 [Neochlamydia sp. AcF65]|uniref:hypothetical protein n=1 Tax=Neochlamydia sp. AcF65 TaxID=2795735 RepID=UPI001BD83816|nr:hypothetical protein [Neochlamydia sp. AcF65]MBS4166786.1 Uncharacterized protein [Neochlamydia sp. AcF65]
MIAIKHNKLTQVNFMRSYYAHLANASPHSALKNFPTCIYRSSAIFPVISLPGISTRLLFMGYWMLKSHVQEIAAQLSLRSGEGKLLYRTSLPIREAKTYRIELIDQLIAAGLPLDHPFIGSLEIEFFSTRHLVFPYPAVAINYYGPAFSTVVHSAQRIYNNFEDMYNNSHSHVPEAGFNIYVDEDHEPFISIINGPQALHQAPLLMEFYNSKNEKLTHEITYPTLQAYQTCLIYPGREIELQKFLNGQPGTAKITCEVNWIFPRLLVGNLQHSLPAMTITHTYYDCSKSMAEHDYWRPAEPQWFPATLMIPLTLQKNLFTTVYFYPIYPPNTLIIDLEIYNQEGKLLGKKGQCLALHSQQSGYQSLSFKDICKKLALDTEQNLAARLIARTEDGTRIPARIKLGLDLGVEGQQMPCNICTNLQPFNPALENKPTSFRWAPILADREKSTVWLLNSSSHIEYTRSAEIDLTFFREKDTERLKRTVILPPHGFRILYAKEDKELCQFLENTIGWFTAVSPNPYISTYYFTEASSGVVGGDHGF